MRLSGGPDDGEDVIKLEAAYGVNSRLRWIPVPGQELFVVWNQTVARDGGRALSDLQLYIGETLAQLVDRQRGHPPDEVRAGRQQAEAGQPTSDSVLPSVHCRIPAVSKLSQ